MKIIRVDNYARESHNYPDILIAENVHEDYINYIVRFLNSTNPVDTDYFFRIVLDGYKLQDYSPV